MSAVCLLFLCVAVALCYMSCLLCCFGPVFLVCVFDGGVLCFVVCVFVVFVSVNISLQLNLRIP